MNQSNSLEAEFKISQLQLQYADKSPQNILRLALAQFNKLSIFFSGAEDVVLIDMASKITRNFQVFVIDTGRLHPQTHELIEEVRKHYNIQIKVLFPDPQQVANLVEQKGLFSFHEDGHQECCAIRKVEPLRRQLANLDAWITGQRQDQSPATRAELPIVQIDKTFSTEERSLVKFNPLANWTSDLVWKYIRYHKVPYNKLHEQGYISIGCQPCTRAVLPNQQEREGRWWWEKAKEKESGIHGQNLSKTKHGHHQVAAHH